MLVKGAEDRWEEAVQCGVSGLSEKDNVFFFFFSDFVCRFLSDLVLGFVLFSFETPFDI